MVENYLKLNVPDKEHKKMKSEARRATLDILVPEISSDEKTEIDESVKNDRLSESN